MSVHRLRRRRVPSWTWKTTILLVVVAMVLVALAPGVTQGSGTVLVAKRQLLTGETATDKDFEVKSIELGELAKLYASPAQLASKLLISRDVAPGELIPLTAVRNPDDRKVPLALQLETAISKQVLPGSLVTLWASPSRYSTKQATEPVAIGALVSDIRVNKSLSRQTTTIELWMDSAFVPAVLMAQADGSTLSVVLEPSLRDAN